MAYVDTQISLAKVEMEERVRNIVRNSFHFLILIILMMFFFLFLNVGIALFLNEYLESRFVGFIWVSCFYLTFAMVFLFDKKKKIVTKIINKIFNGEK